MIARLSALYRWFLKIANPLQSPVLLVLRIDFGYQFFEAGKAKLDDIPKAIENFTNWGVPAPAFNAYFIGWLETICGILLILGLASRLVAVPLVIDMITAFLVADRDSIKSLFSDPDKFFNAAPHNLLFISLVILAFGPGKLSIDALIAARRRKSAPAAAAT
ncbi:MAG TPA: DoxX family protein [Candidatus Angelobacter sp.]|nr:DoxX family protein [Candidatus Angelobacter sp.]